MLSWILWILLSLIIYKFVVEPIRYWRIRGVPHKTPLPFLGNFWPVLMRKISFYDSVIAGYNRFPNSRYSGSFMMTSPALLIRDPELIKRISVKDFEHFTDHRNAGSNDLDILFSKNILQLNGQEWKDMRAMLSPAFTGSKMKAMFVLMADCAQQLADYFVNQEEATMDVEMKDLFTRYTNDVIATCAFGVQCDSLKERNNTFYEMGKDATSFTGWRSLRLLAANFSPGLLRILRIGAFPSYLTDFFISMTQETISYRLKNNIVRPDMIHLLLEARRGRLRHDETIEDRTDSGFAVIEESSIGKVQTNNKEISDIDIAAQAFIFFFAGFDTGSTILSFMATELAINPDVQEKLFFEIDGVMKKCNGKPSYEAITQMKYMDMVVSETLRKWPAGPMTDRKCTKPYKIEAVTPDEKDIIIEIDDIVMIPILGIHRDGQYYPEPERFDPERFSDENKHSILPFTYLPFGIGPRACIGSRFALLEIKVLFAYFLWKFELVPISKTVVPIKLSKNGIKIQPDGGFWLGLKRR